MQELRGAPPPQEADLAAPASARSLMIGALQLDTWRQEARLAGRTLALTPTEFRVLLCWLSIRHHAAVCSTGAQRTRIRHRRVRGRRADQTTYPSLAPKARAGLQRAALHLKRSWK